MGIDEEVVEDWCHTGEQKPGGEITCPDRCMECMLNIKSLFRLGFRQTEGFARSVVLMLELADTDEARQMRRNKTLSSEKSK